MPINASHWFVWGSGLSGVCSLGSLCGPVRVSLCEAIHLVSVLLADIVGALFLALVSEVIYLCYKLYHAMLSLRYHCV
jgi:hypothetical protein